MNSIPDFDDILLASRRTAGHVVRTPVLRSSSLDAAAGCEMHFKCENLQRGGAFKFRGACNAVFALDDAAAARGVVTQSSGNHGAAVAMACRLRGIPATVVVPEGAARVKLDAIARQGATIVRCAPNQAARDATTAQVLRDTGGTLIHPFDDARVIAGQGTAALELLEQVDGLDAVIAPISGGGLLSGTLLATAGGLPVYGAEPEQAADAHASLTRGARVLDWPIDTLCDGLRAHLGQLTFQVLNGKVEVLLASEAEIVAAMRLVWERMKLVIEPSSAVPLAAILRNRGLFAGRKVGVILSGGNVDLDQLPWTRQSLDHR
ncbi:pyridoxal-phosphate dependent enzyme [Alkalisalibacterium limincola]|uniref:Pyridoxal-phosphate dependent enzyme n=1 Tax=Alkalisalibacterium limincola TaxID=2699169 RepID=A0A5C8KRA7_9GAMM|nr:pyridoxal-phosphate dependent enzyme [Alkalisalibacterium limincola]TXK62540.1 pyridoxal-phosphate dependent enzyme [Alkalisalibacterium limincola]